MKNRPQISFDFDGTLRDDPKVQDLAIELIDDPDVDVWVITRRYKGKYSGKESKEVYEQAEYFEVIEERIIFTDREYKSPTLIRLGIDLHIDDDPTECIMQPVGGLNRIICTKDPRWLERAKGFIEDLKDEGKY